MSILISIIMPTYKTEINMIERAIEGVCQQTYSNWELIIVDDNPKNSEYYLKNEVYMNGYKDNNKIKYIKHEKNKGANAARNTGINSANGYLVAFLDSDDKWEKNYLQEVVDKYKNADKKVGLFSTSYSIIYSKGSQLVLQDRETNNIYEKEIYRDIMSPTSAVVARRDCLIEAKGFDELLPARQDYDMWLRICKNYKVCFIKKPLVYIYRNGHESISTNYLNHIKGSEIVLNKIIKSDNKEIDKKKLYNSHYNHIILVCIKNDNFQLAKQYISKAIKNKVDVKTVLLIIFAYIPYSYMFVNYIRKNIISKRLFN